MTTRQDVKARLLDVYEDLLRHDGYGSFRVEMRLLRRGQKEVIVDCGKQYRFVIDFEAPRIRGAGETPGDEGSRDLSENLRRWSPPDGAA